MPGGTINFVNRSKQYWATIYKVDDHNKEVFIADVGPGSSSQQPTGPGDEWIAKAKDSGKKLASVTATGAEQTYKIIWGRGDAGAGT